MQESVCARICVCKNLCARISVQEYLCKNICTRRLITHDMFFAMDMIERTTQKTKQTHEHSIKTKKNTRKRKVRKKSTRVILWRETLFSLLKKKVRKKGTRVILWRETLALHFRIFPDEARSQSDKQTLVRQRFQKIHFLRGKWAPTCFFFQRNDQTSSQKPNHSNTFPIHFLYKMNWRLLIGLGDFLDLAAFVSLRKAERATRKLYRLSTVYDFFVDFHPTIVRIREYTQKCTFEQLLSFTGRVTELPILKVVSDYHIPTWLRPKVSHLYMDHCYNTIAHLPPETTSLTVGRLLFREDDVNRNSFSRLSIKKSHFNCVSSITSPFFDNKYSTRISQGG